MKIEIADTPSHPARRILALSLSAAIGLGICRFAYALVLPDMRDSLGWSYSAAGFMNTINAAGYLAGALGASLIIRRIGLFETLLAGTIACTISLAGSALTGEFTAFSLLRLLSGFGAALSFVAGGALSARIAQAHPERSAFLLSLFYAGPAVGIIASGLIAPLLLDWLGTGSWWIVWAALTMVAGAMTAVLMRSRTAVAPLPQDDASARIGLWPIIPYLAGYFCFGAGYIAYMTFMIAYVRDAGGGALAQSAFWCLIGASACASPWVWRRLMQNSASGGAVGVLIAVVMIGAVLPLINGSPLMLALSAIVFGVSFFAVVGSTTAFVRANYPPALWPAGIAVMTIVFGLGQTLGPIATGALTDALGSLSSGLGLSAAALAVGSVAAFLQRPLRVPA